MLPFQKEPDSLSSDNQNETQANPNLSSGQGGQPEESLEYLTVADRKTQLKRSTYLLVGLLVIGMMCLWFMIKKSGPSQASAAQLSAEQLQQQQLEAAITRITGVKDQMFNSIDKVIKKFYDCANTKQVNVEELSKNPFRTDEVVVDVVVDDSQSQLAIAQSELELISIMGTERGNCCMINDDLLYEGDMIKGFKITRITNDVVMLKSSQGQIQLKLKD